MLLLGLDIGTSSVKVAVLDAATLQCVAAVGFPETEAEIITLQKGWAEQDPEDWWQFAQQAILKAHALKRYDPQDISAIGIAYQMHGLVCVDSNQQVLRNSIIWCDSRAVSIGENANETIGGKKCLDHLLNSPGNFTASKLAWVKQNEPQLFEKIDKVMLPGDFIAMKLTGAITTSIAALSEGIFWDFKENNLSEDIFSYYGFDQSIIPAVHPVFGEHGHLSAAMAGKLNLRAGIAVTYKAGDQPNNALSLNVLKPGEVAATAGTSGVVYAVTDQLFRDQQSRVNTFAHVNYTTQQPRLGVLLCINGTGIMNKWVRQIAGASQSYEVINKAAAAIAPGSDGLRIFPFGNGAERMLNNKLPGAQVMDIDLNKHSAAHLFRASQEGIAFAFRFGLDIMRENGLNPGVIRAGKANMFLSDVFTNAFVNATNTAVELYNNDGSAGAAIGAGIGAGVFTAEAAFNNTQALQTIVPNDADTHENLYQEWKTLLLKTL